MQRLRVADNPLGWLLREAWDRYRDRPFWCSQQAVRVARDLGCGSSERATG